MQVKDHTGNLENIKSASHLWGKVISSMTFLWSNKKRGDTWQVTTAQIRNHQGWHKSWLTNDNENCVNKTYKYKYWCYIWQAKAAWTSYWMCHHNNNLLNNGLIFQHQLMFIYVCDINMGRTSNKWFTVSHDMLVVKDVHLQPHKTEKIWIYYICC